MVKDIVRAMPRVINNSNLIVGKGIQRTYKQITELFSESFILLVHNVIIVIITPLG